MSTKTDEWLDNRRAEIDSAPENGEYSQEISRAILDFLDTYNPEVISIQPPIVQGEREDTLSTSSRLAYASTLHRTAKVLDLLNCSARDLNRHADARRSGEAENTKDGGVTANTVHQNQIAWRSFYRWCDQHEKAPETNVDPETLILVDRGDPAVDERDMFDAEEVKAMRDACQNKRDRALLETLIYTGQRHNALRTLRFKDVDPNQGESGVLYLNETTTDGEGLKGARGKRPLLGAQKAVKDWKDAHPTQDPDDAFFTHLYDWDGHDEIEPGQKLSQQTFGRIPKRIARRAGVEKPANPHAFRHYFVTMAASKHNMSFDTIRHLLGHQDGSRELERTYQHLTDDDHIETAEENMGMREEKEESLTPSTCHTCDEPLDPDWSVCPNCERVYGPDAQSVKDEINKSATVDALNAESEEEKEDLMALLSLAQNPETLNKMTDLVELFRDEFDEDFDPGAAAAALDDD